MTALQVRGVDVSFGTAQILRSVELTASAGEVVALVGPNGAGKSTLLSVISGDVVPAAGQVLIDGRELGSIPVRELARIRAVQLQEASVSFAFTVGQVVEMGRAPWQGTPQQEQDGAAIADGLAQAEVGHLIHRRFPTLSGGEKARTSFARALAQTTPLLLLDEPTAALDIRHQEAVLVRVREQADSGCVVVVVLHDLSLAGAYADRVVLLADGRVSASGTPGEVLRSEVLSPVYGYPVDVIDHPGSGGPVVIPRRERKPAPSREGNCTSARGLVQDAERVSAPDVFDVNEEKS